MSTAIHPEYPSKDLEDAQTFNIIVFSVVLAAFIVTVSLILTALGCVFFSFRRKSYVISKEKKRVKKEVAASNLQQSIGLSKNQRTLRYLAGASQEDHKKKFQLLGYDVTRPSQPLEEEPLKEEEEELVELETDQESLKDEKEGTEPNVTEYTAPPPEYTYPQNIISELTQE